MHILKRKILIFEEEWEKGKEKKNPRTGYFFYD